MRTITQTSPLRNVVDRGIYKVFDWGLGVTQDHLECGHLLAPADDIYGPRYPSRRRCWKCAKGEPVDTAERVG